MRKLLLLFIFVPGWLFGQTENKITQAIDAMVQNHPYRVGVFRVRPSVSIGSGYDSNAIVTGDAPIGDYYSTISPGGSFALKLDRRGYAELGENLNIVYYRGLEPLRDVYTTTDGKLVLGSRRLLLEAQGGYVNKKAPVNYEFDQPAQQKSSYGRAGFMYALRRNTDVNVHVANAQSRYELDPEIDNQLPPPPDTRSVEWGAGIEQLLGRHIYVAVDFVSGRTEFLDEAESANTSDKWEILTGLVFRSKSILGQAKVGFGHTDNLQAQQAAFEDFLIDTKFDFKLGHRISCEVLASRRRNTSAILQDSFRLATEVGGKASISMGRRFSIDGRFSVGRNNYNDAVFNGETITKDDFQRSEGGVGFQIRDDLSIRTGISYHDRKSSVDLLNKDRFTWTVGLAFAPGKEE